MNNKIELPSITGHIEAFLTEKNGNKKKVWEGDNAIAVAFHTTLAEAFNTDVDIALNNLFVDDLEPPDFYDGIMCLMLTTSDVFAGYAAFITTLAQPAAHQLRATGVYTNNTASTRRVSIPYLGKNAHTTVNPYGTDSHYFYDFTIAAATAWTSQDVPAAASLTIVWTITFTVH